jgi:hypothetical protein
MLAHSPGLVIEGASWVGKSSLAGQLVEGADAVLPTLDDEQTRAAVAEGRARIPRPSTRRNPRH